MFLGCDGAHWLTNKQWTQGCYESDERTDFKHVCLCSLCFQIRLTNAKIFFFTPQDTSLLKKRGKKEWKKCDLACINTRTTARLRPVTETTSHSWTICHGILEADFCGLRFKDSTGISTPAFLFSHFKSQMLYVMDGRLIFPKTFTSSAKMSTQVWRIVSVSSCYDH